MIELNTQIELVVSEIISATRKSKTLEDLAKANENGIKDITKLVKNLTIPLGVDSCSCTMRRNKTKRNV